MLLPTRVLGQLEADQRELLARIPTMSLRGKKLEKELGAFLKQYARKAYKTIDPNDRRFDRRIERLVKQMKPEELDRLLRDGLDNEDRSTH
jgi:hypothetical protein